ncbi:ADPribosylglycohydrolase superfamily protein [Acanthamoeba castellanii str. Neff]|uniref:ADP-ribosylhydrolase ARH3 n=1 Tax=Acanthamoeba castellanii (strain ATCC 30010 / Neff) TaxID=1257118 RepID=L8GGT7_ACACF|nr:ADPribosylglycohydrolase superfamily protein [Acanthamoeba castellanii str. Neff]ELR12305.1 ADPribosylglycohydrolase superfamily protein [Acanthamoeba castellanii str. Neff]
MEHEEQEREEGQEVVVGEVEKKEEERQLTEGWSAAEAEAKADEADRVRGSFLGLAWGDVFGCPVEGWRSGAIQQVYGDYVELPSEHSVATIAALGRGYIRKLRPIGLYSDDTQQCMVLIQCCLFGKDQPEPSEHAEDSDEDDASESSEEGETAEVADASVPPPSAVATTAAAPAAAKPLPKGMGRVLSGPGPEVRVEWNARRWGRTLGLMFRRDALRDYGRHFKEAVSKLSHNIPPQQSGSKSEGMGAAMRIGALGALFRNDPETLAACAWEASLATHATLPAASMAYAVAYAVACLVKGLGVAEVRDRLPGAVAAREKQWLLDQGKWEIWASTDNCHLISHCLRTVFTECDMTDRAGLRAFLSENAKPHLAEGFVKAHPNQGHVLLGGAHGLIMALLPDIEPQEILREIIVLGYDTDTVAAICGSVLGARFGTGWIPMHRLLERERLETYAKALVTGTTADKRRPHELETLEELVEKEVKLTAWGRSVKRQNGLGKKNAHVQGGAGAGGDAEGDEKGEDSGRGGRGKSGKKERKGKGKNKGRRDGEYH